MGVVMKIVGFASGAQCNHEDEYIEAFDFEAHDGLGHAEVTPDINKAKRFVSVDEATKFWRTIPKCKPFREDGTPNRPLTCATIEIWTEVEDAHHPAPV